MQSVLFQGPLVLKPLPRNPFQDSHNVFLTQIPWGRENRYQHPPWFVSEEREAQREDESLE